MYWIGLEKIIQNCADFQQENTENLMLYLCNQRSSVSHSSCLASELSGFA
jgi:hypothetical protein